MATDIVHDAEVHRQHVRLRIPITIEIDGTSYTVDDWSLGGFGVQGDLSSRRPGERFPARLRLPFEDFELSLDVDCELIYRLADGSRFGARFLTLGAGQLALFRYVVDAYLSGELVGAGDLLAVVGRAASEPGAGDPASRAERRPPGLGRRLRRAAGVLLLLAAGAAIGAAAWFGARERWLTVRAEAAIVEAPVVRILAPAAGVLRPGEPEPVLGIGSLLGDVRDAAGETHALASPCECALLEWLAAPGQAVQGGEPVALLAAADQPLLVRAAVPPRVAHRLGPGDAAVIVLPGRAEALRGRIERVDRRSQLLGLASGDSLAAARRPLQVLIRPDRPLDFDLLGAPVEVRFP